MTPLAVGLSAALVAVILLGIGAAGVVSRINVLENRPSIRVPQTFDPSHLESRIDKHGALFYDLKKEMGSMTIAISEGIERVARAEQRVAETVRRAKRRADQAGYVDPGIEAEVAELQRLDDDGGNQSSVPVLYEGVENNVGDASSIKGVTVDQLQRARGW